MKDDAISTEPKEVAAMSFSVLADVGGPILFAGFGVVAYLVLSLLESIVLRLLKWGMY